MTPRVSRVIFYLIWIGAALVLVVLIHGLTQRVSSAEEKASDARTLATKNADTAGQALTAAQRLANQVKGLGAKPVVEPSSLPTTSVTPAKGDTGQPGADSTVAGPQGPGPTDAQVSAGVAAYCGVASRCVGPSGATGAKGADSTVPGPAGPAGKDGADSTVPGPQGAPGDTGPAGYPASFTFTYLATTYVCTDPAGDHNYTCEAA